MKRQRKRRVSQRAERVRRVLDVMQTGVTLHRCHDAGRIIWVLSDGQQLTGDIVIGVLASKLVVGCGDGLFGCELSQTFALSDAANKVRIALNQP